MLLPLILTTIAIFWIVSTITEDNNIGIITTLIFIIISLVCLPELTEGINFKWSNMVYPLPVVLLMIIGITFGLGSFTSLNVSTQWFIVVVLTVVFLVIAAKFDLHIGLGVGRGAIDYRR